MVLMNVLVMADEGCQCGCYSVLMHVLLNDNYNGGVRGYGRYQ